MPSRTIENYLKNLYLEQQHAPAKDPVAMGRLATLMNVVPGTATTMVKALADSRLVHYSPALRVNLAPAGKQLALHVLRRHRLVELFLVRIVGLDWSEVHAEAEELEHVISDKLLDRIDALLGHPATDPHGDPIPTAAGHVPPADIHTLATCPLHRAVTITRIIDQARDFLRFAEQSGLTPGTRLQITSRNPLAESVMLKRQGKRDLLTLSLPAAAKFLVRVAPARVASASR